MVLKQLDLQNCKPVKSPSEKQTATEAAARLAMPTVPPDRVSFFRSLVMRIAFLSQGRPDLAEATKCLARRMANPNEADFKDLKRLGRYLKGSTRMVQRFYPQHHCREITMYVDADFNWMFSNETINEWYGLFLWETRCETFKHLTVDNPLVKVSTIRYHEKEFR